MNIKVEIAPGELIDKLTILEIKLQKISEKNKLKNIRHEYSVLQQTFRRHVPSNDALEPLISELKKVNEALWVIEDQIRDCEREKDFGGKFIGLARSVYRNNDKRAELKREINILLDSNIIEEKSYQSYDQ